MPQNKFCPICVSYMLTLTASIELFNHKKCPTCGWQEDLDGNNEITKKLDKLNISEQERKYRIKNWRKLRDSGEL